LLLIIILFVITRYIISADTVSCSSDLISMCYLTTKLIYLESFSSSYVLIN